MAKKSEAKIGSPEWRIEFLEESKAHTEGMLTSLMQSMLNISKLVLDQSNTIAEQKKLIEQKKPRYLVVKEITDEKEIAQLG